MGHFQQRTVELRGVSGGTFHRTHAISFDSLCLSLSLLLSHSPEFLHLSPSLSLSVCLSSCTISITPMSQCRPTSAYKHTTKHHETPKTSSESEYL